MEFSIWPNMSHTPAEVFDIARWADATGWYGVWYADHYMPNTGSDEIKPGDTHECWAMLPAIAAVTERVRVGSLVAPTSVHHPAVLANRAATIDHVSAGRMVLGLGAGWQINEHRAYGIELEPPKQRVDRFEEAIQIIRSLLGHDRTTFDGSVYTITDAPADPKPVQSPLPILVGTGGRRMLRITARHADEWNTWGGVAMAGERRAALRAAAESVERDPASMWTSVQALVFLTDDDAAARKVLEGDLGPRSIAGSAGKLVDELGAYRELGFDEFIVPDFNLGPTPAARRESLERLQSEVIGPLA
jgi:alkanesulfonate monooxygenase SsuD/methylene tetrahydromethanopterin reductase-like flavin-dependent oxidoreductase (luciferase family)